MDDYLFLSNAVSFHEIRKINKIQRAFIYHKMSWYHVNSQYDLNIPRLDTFTRDTKDIPFYNA